MAKSKQPKFRSAYNQGSLDYSEHFPDGLTEQHHTPLCDANLIIGQFLHQEPNMDDLQYGDLSEHNFTTAQNEIAKAKTLFEELPTHVKDRFDNNYISFLHFADNPDNIDSMVEMGLASIPEDRSTDPALQTQAGEETTSLPAGKSEDSDAADVLST